MKLFVLRHGEAEYSASTDQERQLTEHGKSEVRSAVEKSLSKLKVVKHIFVSPYIRAQQTAGIVHELLPDIAMSTLPMITPSGKVSEVLDFLQNENIENVLLVSHQPLVGDLVSELVGQPVGFYRMSTAALAYVKTDVYAIGCGTLRWIK
ncbi:MAG: phosphohistidine phosphatase SixA [Cellvibrionaceae bacterium]